MGEGERAGVRGKPDTPCAFSCDGSKSVVPISHGGSLTACGVARAGI